MLASIVAIHRCIALTFHCLAIRCLSEQPMLPSHVSHFYQQVAQPASPGNYEILILNVIERTVPPVIECLRVTDSRTAYSLCLVSNS